MLNPTLLASERCSTNTQATKQLTMKIDSFDRINRGVTKLDIHHVNDNQKLIHVEDVRFRMYPRLQHLS